MNILEKVENLFNSSVWMMLFSFTVLIMLWVGFLFNIPIPGAVVQVYMAVLGAFAVNKTVLSYKNGNNNGDKS